MGRRSALRPVRGSGGGRQRGTDRYGLGHRDRVSLLFNPHHSPAPAATGAGGPPGLPAGKSTTRANSAEVADSTEKALREVTADHSNVPPTNPTLSDVFLCFPEPPRTIGRRSTTDNMRSQTGTSGAKTSEISPHRDRDNGSAHPKFRDENSELPLFRATLRPPGWFVGDLRRCMGPDRTFAWRAVGHARDPLITPPSTG
jgi:hypothetical protein